MDFDNECYAVGLLSELESDSAGICSSLVMLLEKHPIVDGDDNSHAMAARSAGAEVLLESLLKSNQRFINRIRREL